MLARAALVTLAIALIQLVSSVMPSVAVPDFLTTYAWPAQMLSFVGWLVPFGALSWMLMAWVSYEVAHFVLLILHGFAMSIELLQGYTGCGKSYMAMVKVVDHLYEGGVVGLTTWVE